MRLHRSKPYCYSSVLTTQCFACLLILTTLKTARSPRSQSQGHASSRPRPQHFVLEVSSRSRQSSRTPSLQIGYGYYWNFTTGLLRDPSSTNYDHRPPPPNWGLMRHDIIISLFLIRRRQGCCGDIQNSASNLTLTRKRTEHFTIIDL